MRSPEIAIRMNVSQILENGIRVTAVKTKEMKEPEIIPGKTANHEARHAVAARRNGTGVESATIIPGPGYLGMTKLSKFDAIAAAAAHAHGDSGTGHDLSIIRASGISESAAINGARSTLSGAEKEVYAVASLLEKKGTLSGSEIDTAMVGSEKNETSMASIFINMPDGREEKRKVEASGETIMIPGEWVAISSKSQ